MTRRQIKITKHQLETITTRFQVSFMCLKQYRERLRSSLRAITDTIPISAHNALCRAALCALSLLIGFMCRAVRLGIA